MRRSHAPWGRGESIKSYHPGALVCAGRALPFCECKYRTREAGRCWATNRMDCGRWQAATWHLEPLPMFGNFPALGVWVDGTERGSRLATPAPTHFPFLRFHELPNTLSGKSFLAKYTIKRIVGFCSYKMRTLTDTGGYCLISSI